jgi:hypothetical protein
MIYKPAQVGNNVLLNIDDVFLKEVIQKHNTIISVEKRLTSSILPMRVFSDHFFSIVFYICN